MGVTYISETSKIRDKVIKYCEGRGLDIGAKHDKIKPDSIGIDRNKEVGVDVVCDALDLLFKSDVFDYVYSSHCLEHIVDTKAALKEWRRVLKQGGKLILYLPHKDLYKGVNLDHKHDFVPEDITTMLTDIGFKILENYVDDNAEEDKYSFTVVAEKIIK